MSILAKYAHILSAPSLPSLDQTETDNKSSVNEDGGDLNMDDPVGDGDVGELGNTYGPRTDGIPPSLPIHTHPPFFHTHDFGTFLFLCVLDDCVCRAVDGVR